MVVSAWNTGISTKQLINLEEKYVQHHQFVAAVLNTDAAHSMLPHGKLIFISIQFTSFTFKNVMKNNNYLNLNSGNPGCCFDSQLSYGAKITTIKF